MLSQNKDWENSSGFVCYVEVVFMIVGVNGQKEAITPYFNCKQEDPVVVLPVRKNLISSSVS